MEIVGREREKKELYDSYKSNKAELVVIYGRSGVGKTFLVRKFFEDNLFFSFSGSNKDSGKNQIKDFMTSLDYNKIVVNWRDCFSSLKNKIEKSKIKGKKVIFIDEVSLIKKVGTQFLSSFEYFWNTFCSTRDDLLIILCSSSTSFITKNIFFDKGGLYNRLTNKICLKPFTLAETEKYLVSLGFSFSKYDISEIYMVIGGIPNYLSFIKRGLSVAQNIDNMFFSQNPILKDEFERLFASLFKNPKPYINIIKILYTIKRGITRSELVSLLMINDGGSLTRLLNDLELCDIIKKYQRFSNNKNNSLYQLTDPFCLFYLSFVEDNNDNNSDYYLSLLKSPKINTWRGYAFEMLCFSHIEQIKKFIGIDKIQTSISSMKDKDMQIDLIIKRADRVIDLCEIKFYTDEYEITKKEDLEIKHKKTLFLKYIKQNESINVIYITTYGLKKNMYSSFVESELKLEDLF